MSPPILSKRARRETPKLGGANYRASIPRTNSTLTAFLGLDTLSVPSIEDLPTHPVDDVLCVLPLFMNVVFMANLCPFVEIFASNLIRLLVHVHDYSFNRSGFLPGQKYLLIALRTHLMCLNF